MPRSGAKALLRLMNFDAAQKRPEQKTQAAGEFGLVTAWVGYPTCFARVCGRMSYMMSPIWLIPDSTTLAPLVSVVSFLL
jgi:hypothetical protein